MQIDDRSFLQALRDSYGALSWSDYWHGKLQNLQQLVGFLAARTARPAGRAVHRQWSPEAVRNGRLLRAGAFAARVRDRRDRGAGAARAVRRVRSERSRLRMLVAVLGTLAAFVLLIFIPGADHQSSGTYAVQVLATIFAFMVLTLRVPWLALLFIAGQAVTRLGDLCVQPAARSRVLAAAGSLRRGDALASGLFTRAAVRPNRLANRRPRATACRDARGGRSRNGRSSRRRHPPDGRRSAPGASR